jgi:hypothetical protein
MDDQQKGRPRLMCKVTDAAIEAACCEVWPHLFDGPEDPEQPLTVWREIMDAALTAALPHMIGPSDAREADK